MAATQIIKSGTGWPRTNQGTNNVNDSQQKLQPNQSMTLNRTINL